MHLRSEFHRDASQYWKRLMDKPSARHLYLTFVVNRNMLRILGYVWASSKVKDVLCLLPIKAGAVLL